MNVLDTNVWLYCHDSRDPAKQSIALNLSASVRPILLPWQVGCEFLAPSRKLAVLGFTDDVAWYALQRMLVIARTILLDARALRQRFSLSIWDSLLVAACLYGGAQTLYTEDFGGSKQIDTLAIINPFKAH